VREKGVEGPLAYAAGLLAQKRDHCDGAGTRQTV
jgi:hypothetical protein